jgi:phosphoglycolate phosphatase-like HAD superfamily hydrolase
VDQIVFFGDALSDYEAANSLGCMFVGIGEDIEKILSSHSSFPKQPLYLLEDFSEIL